MYLRMHVTRWSLVQLWSTSKCDFPPRNAVFLTRTLNKKKLCKRSVSFFLISFSSEKTGDRHPWWHRRYTSDTIITTNNNGQFSIMIWDQREHVRVHVYLVTLFFLFHPIFKRHYWLTENDRCEHGWLPTWKSTNEKNEFASAPRKNNNDHNVRAGVRSIVITKFSGSLRIIMLAEYKPCAEYTLDYYDKKEKKI